MSEYTRGFADGWERAMTKAADVLTELGDGDPVLVEVTEDDDLVNRVADAESAVTGEGNHIVSLAEWIRDEPSPDIGW